MKFKVYFVSVFLSTFVFGQQFTESEKKIFLNNDVSQPLKIIQVTDENELKILNSQSIDIDPRDKNISVLKNRMFLAMRSETSLGVAIAAPQVGINRNLIWVQRFDKVDKPFEFYINPKIVWKSDLMSFGAEGCLSIPEDTATVYRHYLVKISYFKDAKVTEEQVEGFAAVIFQHEVDHLNGILLTDRKVEQMHKKYIIQNSLTNFFIEQAFKN